MKIVKHFGHVAGCVARIIRTRSRWRVCWRLCTSMYIVPCTLYTALWCSINRSCHAVVTCDRPVLARSKLMVHLVDGASCWWGHTKSANGVAMVMQSSNSFTLAGSCFNHANFLVSLGKHWLRIGLSSTYFGWLFYILSTENILRQTMHRYLLIINLRYHSLLVNVTANRAKLIYGIMQLESVIWLLYVPRNLYSSSDIHEVLRSNVGHTCYWLK